MKSDKSYTLMVLMAVSLTMTIGVMMVDDVDIMVMMVTRMIMTTEGLRSEIEAGANETTRRKKLVRPQNGRQLR